MKILYALLSLGAFMNGPTGLTSEKYTFVSYKKLISGRPDIEGKNVKVWNIKQNGTIRINIVEMSGELHLHKHPDAEHSLMVLEGKVRVRIGNDYLEVGEGDFVSIPENIPHKYWSLTAKSMLVSMDAPYYDPKRTIVLE